MGFNVNKCYIIHMAEVSRCGSRICVGGGGEPSRDFTDIVQQSHDDGKILGLKMGGQRGGPGPQGPLLDLHLGECSNMPSETHLH